MGARGPRLPDAGPRESDLLPPYFPQALRDAFEIVFCDLRQWAPTPEGFDVATITIETFAADVEAVRQATASDRPIVVPYYLWDEPKRRLLNLRYELYDKSGHQPPYEQPREFTAHIVEWAQRL